MGKGHVITCTFHYLSCTDLIKPNLHFSYLYLFYFFLLIFFCLFVALEGSTFTKMFLDLCLFLLVNVPNVAEGKATEMSSVKGIYDGSKGVDGNTDQNLDTGHSCFETTDTPVPPWWRVDLSEVNIIITVVLYNRLDMSSSN